MGSETHSDTESRVSTPEWHESPSSTADDSGMNSPDEIGQAIPMPSPSEQREMQQESTEGKSGEIKANEENGNEDEASKVASEPKQKPTSMEDLTKTMDLSTLTPSERAALKLPNTPETMDDGDDPHFQRTNRSTSQSLGYHTPTPAPLKGRGSTTSSPFFQKPAALASSVSLSPSIFGTPASAFKPEATAAQLSTLERFRAYLNAGREEPVTEHDAPLLNYLRSMDWDMEAAAVNYDARLERIKRTRETVAEQVEFVRRFNAGRGRPLRG